MCTHENVLAYWYKCDYDTMTSLVLYTERDSKGASV